MPVRCLLIALLLMGVQSVQANPLLEIAQNRTHAGRELRNFFETGRVSPEDRLMFQRPPTGVIPLQQTVNSWQFIIFKEGNVSFWIPPGVLTDEKVVLETSLGSINFRTLASNRDDRRYVAAYAADLTPEQLKDPQNLLQAVRDKVAPQDEFKLQNERSITLDSYPGQELTVENQEETIIIRVYFANNQIYALGVRHPKPDPEPRSTRAFLNALELID
ncbi:periplasmic protein, function unknown [Rippkaea orientalis PCC 8801]|uniref:Outer membrane lipoprotein carrier protein LolA n=1 Tax=Rippkaea orientalis (strain PCC 8801 / RF-1) TaxID=41431 RepID=B7JWM5_RIPO1|nr:hypothetical protein [Rippkaea orientalis]ACK68366.1 periplasmic protein, function unknown [Rippkaea orientalis PCC 8801]